MPPMRTRLVFCEPVQRLQNIAAFKAALDLWIYYIECESKGATNTILGRICRTDSYRTREVDVRKMVDLLELPKIVEDAIKQHVKSICAQVLTLSAYCRHQVFFRDLEVERSLSGFIWRPDGTIDYEKVIKSVIEGSELNERQRFALMCEYCMEDKIREAWPQLKDRKFLEDAEFESNPLTVYWSCVMTEDFSRMRVDDIFAARHRVLESSRTLNSNAVEYLFGQMNACKRISIGTYLMEKGGAKMAKILMSMYTPYEQQLMLFCSSNFFIKLIKIFAVPEYHPEYALHTWQYMMNWVDGNQFISMLQKIGNARLYSHCIHELLVELWHCSPNLLKEFVYQLPEDNEFVCRLGVRPSYVSPHWEFCQREDGILIEILVDAEPEFRKKFWRRYCIDIVNRSRPSSLKTIMGLCLSTNEVNEFKINVICSNAIRRYFIDLIVNGKYSDLNEFLEMFVCGGKREIDEFRRELLLNMSDLTSIVKKCEPTDGSVNALKDFLAEVFGDDVQALVEFKIKMVCECLSPSALCMRYELVRIFCVSERLCDEQTLIEVKERILQICRELAYQLEIRQTMEQAEWSILLRWCLGSEKSVSNFNKSLLIRKRSDEI